MANIPDTLSQKMLQGCSVQPKAKISEQSSKKSAKSKTVKFIFLDLRSGKTQERFWEMISQSHGEYSIRNTGMSPKEENASTLSQILMAQVPEKHYLSPKACQGILRRASARGKQLPEVLRKALERQAKSV